MTSVATIGLDIAKSVFQVHGVDTAGQVVVRQRLARRRVLAFFEKLAPVWSGLRLAAPRITGRGNSSRVDTKSA